MITGNSVYRFKLDLSAISDGTIHFKILREALLKSLHDIDLVFAKVCFNLISSSCINDIKITHPMVVSHYGNLRNEGCF